MHALFTQLEGAAQAEQLPDGRPQEAAVPRQEGGATQVLLRQEESCGQGPHAG